MTSVFTDSEVALAPRRQPSREEKLAHQLPHGNDPDDARYHSFLFYLLETCHHLAKRNGWICEVPRKDVAVTRRPVVADAA